ncbi:MAG: LiaF-related protein [Acidobacteriota bacterium]|nr:LiaF-related protein [Acidobacteriota bacterium]
MTRGPYVGRGMLGIVAIMVLGVVIAESDATRDSTGGEDASRLDSGAFLGSVEHRNLSAAFLGGEAAAVMGRLEVDLRGAAMAAEEVVIEVDVVMGRVEILVPDDWRVVSEVEAVLGAAEVRTSRREAAAGAPLLVVRGGVLMGRLYVGD